MANEIEDHAWVWVVIQDPETEARIVGQEDPGARLTFIPTFKSKDEAWQCFNLLSLDAKHKAEVQAIIFEDLKHYAARSGWMIFILNGRGQIQEKISV